VRFVRITTTVSVLIFGALLQLGGTAYAASCSTHPSGGDALLAGSPGDVDTSDMSFRGNPADGCSGVYDGNNSDAEVHAVALQLGTTLDALQPELKADGAGSAGSALYDGISWSLSYETGSEPNTWVLGFSADPDLVRSYDVIAAIKQGAGWAVFRFAEELFATDGSGSGSFFIDWCGGSGNFSFACDSDDLSHLSVYLSSTEIPEPGGLVLVALALLGLAIRRQVRITTLTPNC
jgi:PEP-CTERM motif